MRHILIASVVWLAGLAGSVEPAHAAPFCMMSSVYMGMPDCSYRTWAQCRANLGGLGDYCYTNSLGGYVFDLRDPANPRVVTPKVAPKGTPEGARKPRRKARRQS